MTRVRSLPPWAWLLIPLFLGAAARGLWAPDEPRRAEVAREVYEAGHWLVLHLCGRPYPDKPPLAYWLFGVVGWLSGWNVFAMRLVSIGASAFTAALVARLARRWWGETEATWAPILFLSTLGVALEGARIQLDPLLLLATTAALERADRPAPSRAQASRRALGVGLWCGVGGLLKGPVAWLIVLVVLAAWRGRASATNLRADARARLAAVGLAVLPVAIWAAAVSAVEPRLARELFFAQHAGRIVGGSVPHAAPIWKYCAELPLLLLPWTGPVLAGLGGALRGTARVDVGQTRAARWLLSVFVLFSLMSAKRGIYLLPLYPAAALLGARWLALARLARPKPWLAWSSALVFGLPALAVLALVGLVPLGLVPVDLSGLERGRLEWALIILSTGALLGALRLARRSEIGAWSRELARTFGVLLALAFALLWPLLDPVRCAKSAALRLAARPERPLEIPCLGVHPEAFRFYAGVPAVRVDKMRQIDAALAREQSQFLAVVSTKVWQSWGTEQHARFTVLAGGGAGRHAHVVIGSPPRASAGL